MISGLAALALTAQGVKKTDRFENIESSWRAVIGGERRCGVARGAMSLAPNWFAFGSIES